jgi:serine/threonine protein kinase/DNA-binding winged helix-turn-helix (wHTH) protein/tetratricopeptide (TPR) repeat protein
MKVGLPNRLRFGAFELDRMAGELRKGRATIRLQEQPFQILLMLLDNGGKVVSREEIKKRLWPNDTVVEFDHSIHTAIKKLRQALGDSAESPKYVETVARRGYRLIVAVEMVPTDDPSDSIPIPSASPGQALSPQASDNDEAPPAPMVEPTGLIGKKVSHYRVLAVIGGGGMGMVYQAEDLKLGRRVALKFLPEELANDSLALQRFEREARTASSLNHANICTIHEVEEHEGQPFIVMELLEGETLRDRLATLANVQKQLPLENLLDIAIQICSGLQASHVKDIIHRDIKPANIFLTSKGVVKILDFGLAKLVEAGEKEQTLDGVIPSAERREASRDPYDRDDLDGIGVPRVAGRPLSRTTSSLGMIQENDALDGAASAAPLPHATPVEHTLTRTGAAMGTAAYMSPEQVRGEKLDARTDLFSFGLVLYEMATGERAFTGQTAAILKDTILNGTPVPVREFNPTISPKLEEVIGKAIEKNREMRYQSAVEMRTDLEKHKGDLQPAAARSGARRRLNAASVTVVVLSMIAAATFWTHLRKTPPKLSEKDTLVVADFANSTGEAVFDGTLKQALATHLAQSPFLNVLSNERVNATLRLMNRPASEHLTEATALELCLRTNSRGALQGSIASRGRDYILEVRAVDCHTGDKLAGTGASATDRNQVLTAVGDIGNQLRKQLGESLASVEEYNQPLQQATTSSLEALQAYSQGDAQQSQKGDAAAIPYYKLAVELDPNFAYAHAALGQAYFTLYEVSLALEEFGRAFALRDRVSQRERFYIEGKYYSMAGDLNKSIQTYEEWAQAYPRDYMAHNDLSRRLRSAGQYERSADEARQALAITRDSVSPFTSLMLASIRLNRLDDAKAAFEEAQARTLEGPYLRLARYQVAFLEGDDQGMAEQVAAAKGKPGTEDILLHGQAYTEAYYGRLRKSRDLSERAAEASQQVSAPERAAIDKTWQALQEVEAGRPDRARQRVVEALALSKGEFVIAKAALALARAGNSEQAQKQADQLNQKLPSETMEQNYSLPVIRAAIELAKNNPGKAINILKATLPYDLGAGSICCFYPGYVRGLAYLKAGQGKEAAGEFDKILNHRGTTVNFITGSLAHLQLGRAQVMMGAREAARKSYQDFLTLWKDADPDIPIYRQAKAEYAKLNQASFSKTAAPKQQR